MVMCIQYRVFWVFHHLVPEQVSDVKEELEGLASIFRLEVT
jgi:hypothetical protein